MQQLDINEHEANNRFSDLFKESVNMRLMSDVPYGAYLSGGVDSSSILAIMKEFVQDKIKTFSIGFKNEFDELKQARQVADFFGTEHNEIEMEPKDLYLLPKVLWHMDDPYGDAIVLPMYLLSRLARKKVKVVLTGEGADELLGGYVYQKNMYLGYIFDRLFQSGIKRRMTSNFVKAIPEDLLNKFFHYPSHLGQEGKNRLVRYLNTFNNLGENYLSLTGLFTAEDKQSLYSGYLKNELSNSRKNSPEDEIRYLLERKKGSNYFNDLLNLGFGHWLSDNILFSQDKTAMANSIETRVPFLDHRLVEFVCTLPVKYKLRNFITDKYILRESMRKALPKTSSKRRKQAFRVPVESSFKKPFDELINIYLSEKRIRKRNYFNYDFIKKLISKKEDEMLYNMQLMALVMLEMWFEVFLDKRTKIFEEAGVL